MIFLWQTAAASNPLPIARGGFVYGHRRDPLHHAGHLDRPDPLAVEVFFVAVAVFAAVAFLVAVFLAAVLVVAFFSTMSLVIICSEKCLFRKHFLNYSDAKLKKII